MQDEIGAVALGSLWACVAVFACAAVVVCAVWRRRRLRSSTAVWALPFAAVAAFLAVWCANGLCQIAPLDFCLCQLVCAVLGIAVLFRDSAMRVCAMLSDKVTQLVCGNGLEEAGSGEKGRVIGCRVAASLPLWVRDALLLAVAAWFSFAALEMADNSGWTAIAEPLRNQALLVIGLALLALYFLGQRRGALCVAVPVVCAVFGLVQNYLDLFKNTALLPSDVLAWQTAAAVGGGYTYVLPTLAIQAIVSALVAIAALAYIVPLCRADQGMSFSPGAKLISQVRDAQNESSSRRKTHFPGQGRIVPRGVAVVANVALCAVCVWGVWENIVALDYRDTFDVELDYWDLRNSYHEHGFLASFVTAMQDLRIEEPQGYSDEAACELQESLAHDYDAHAAQARKAAVARYEKQKPNVIAVMNESYADLSLFEELHVGYSGTYVTQDVATSASAQEGELAMSVHGGGTCNSEYEFLAQSSMGFLSSGMYPYQQFSFANAPTLPSAFKQLGYGTWGMHPNYPGNWNRELVYADMGIDNTLFVYDFADPELFHDFVSDRETYKRALAIIEEADDPQFVLDITMQNHGGYDTGSIPKSQMTDYHPDFLDGDGDATFALNEYLSCVHESDEALKYLFGELAALDEPVAVVFFGDHQPSMSRDYNDALFADEDELTHKARITKTPYFIWTNYGSDDGKNAGASDAATMSSALFLGAQLLEAMGAPLDDYQKALLELHRQVLAVNTNGYCDANGVWHEPADGETPDAPYHQLEILHYFNVVRNL